jgi:hypothetical protein
MLKGVLGDIWSAKRCIVCFALVLAYLERVGGVASPDCKKKISWVSSLVDEMEL